jgi:1-acyl-sn-glycerol-3-phosphate acyltransferase
VPQPRGSTPKGVVTITLLALNVIVMVPVLMVAALLRLLVPLRGWRRGMGRVMTAIAELWIGGNNAIFRLLGALRIDARGLAGLQQRDWYLVLSNHRSWVDILVLQSVFKGRIPFLKFFLKQQLIWVPFLGLAWWALDFPFMRRHTSEYLAKHPEERGKDLEATRKACARFAEIPTSVMNFVEGTRYTQEKSVRFKSPYRHLLPPRAGGVAFVLAAMGGVLQSMVDVTIAYREASPTLWDLCCGRLQTVVVEVVRRPIEAWTTEGDYMEDESFRRRFQAWLGELWQEKDARLDALLPSGPA